MPIVEVGAGTGAEGTYGTGLTINRPGTLAASDTVVIVLSSDTSTVMDSTLSGCTRVFADVDTGNNVTQVEVLIGSGFTGSGSFTITTSLASTDYIIGTCTAWSGVTDYVVGSAFSASPAGANFDIPAVTTTQADALVLAVGGQTFVSAPRTFSPTHAAEASQNNCFQASRTQASAGSTGVATVTNTAFSSAVALLIALQETPSLPSPPRRSHPRLGLITR